MRKLLGIALILGLAGCGGGADTGTLGKEAVAQLIKVAVQQSCNVAPSLTDIITSLGGTALGPAGVIAAPLVNAFVKNYTKTLCDQWTAKQSIHALTDGGCVAVMNGICIHKGE